MPIDATSIDANEHLHIESAPIFCMLKLKARGARARIVKKRKARL